MTGRGWRGYSDRVRNNGESNPATYVLLVLLALVGYYAYFVVPVYLDNLEVKEAVSEAHNGWFTEGGRAQSRDRLLVRLNQRNPDVTHFEVDEAGVETEKPGFGITQEQVSFDYDESSKRLTIRVEYDRIVTFVPFKKRKTYHFVVERTGAQIGSAGK